MMIDELKTYMAELEKFKKGEEWSSDGELYGVGSKIAREIAVNEDHLAWCTVGERFRLLYGTLFLCGKAPECGSPLDDFIGALACTAFELGVALSSRLDETERRDIEQGIFPLDK